MGRNAPKYLGEQGGLDAGDKQKDPLSTPGSKGIWSLSLVEKTANP